MAKHSKRSILAILLALCIACSTGVLAACGDKDDKSVTYTVTVMKDANTAASGVKVTPRKGNARFDAKTTDANGKVTFSLASDTYTVTLSNIPEHYELPEDADLTLTPQKTSLTVTLAPKTSYTVNLVTPDGDPFTAQTQGVEVLICTLDGTCTEPVTPNENGTVVQELGKNDYHVKVTGLVGYAYENDANDYYVGELSATVTEIDIPLYPVSAVDLTTAMTPDEKATFATACTAAGVNGFDADKEAYKLASKTIAAGEYVYYSLTPAASSLYNLYAPDGVRYYFSSTFKVDPAANSTYLTEHRSVSLDAGKTYYIAAKNAGDAAVVSNAAFSAASTTYLAYNGVGGTFDLSVGDEDSNAVIDFAPTSAGEYKLTVQGTTVAALRVTRTDPGSVEIASPGFETTDYAAGNHVEEYYASWDLDNKVHLYFAVAVDSATWPATVQVKLEKSRDKNDSYTDKVAQSLPNDPTDVYAPDTTGKELVGVPMTEDAADALVYNNATDRYTYNGKEVVVMLTEGIGVDRYEDGLPLAYIDQQYDNMSYVQTKTANGGYGYDKVDYRYFLRGFKNYELNRVNQKLIPDQLDVDKCYANFVNEDGVYPLTKELKECLEVLVALNDWYDDVNYFYGALDSVINAEDDAAKWMFPLYYYDAETEADEIVGTYYDDDFTYELIINKNGTFVINEIGESMYDNGSWEKNGGTGEYTFTCTYGTAMTYDSENAEFNWQDHSADSEWDYIDLWFTAKEYPVIAGEYAVGGKTLTVRVDGTWLLESDSGSSSGTWEKNDDDDYYTFIDVDPNYARDSIHYTVIRNEDTGVLTFMRNEDSIIGQYTSVAMPSHSNGEYSLTVNADGFVISTDSEELFVGTWEAGADDNTYTFTVPGTDASSDLHFTVVYDPNSNTLTFTAQETVADGPQTYRFELVSLGGVYLPVVAD